MQRKGGVALTDTMMRRNIPPTRDTPSGFIRRAERIHGGSETAQKFIGGNEVIERFIGGETDCRKVQSPDVGYIQDKTAPMC